MEIGAGITIGGGITLEVPSGGGGGSGNLGSIVDSSTAYFDGMYSGTIYGAATAGEFSFSAFGTVSGGTYRLTYLPAFGGQTALYLVNGTYSGFTVSSGCINGDTSSTQSFTVDGVTANLPCQGTRYFTTGNPFSLDTKVGQTLSVSVNI